MAKKKDTKPATATESKHPFEHRIWIELEPHEDKAVMQQRCDMANKMLAKLTPRKHVGRDHNGFQVFEDKGRTYYAYGSGAYGLRVLTDHGTWFNLDYFGGKGA